MDNFFIKIMDNLHQNYGQITSKLWTNYIKIMDKLHQIMDNLLQNYGQFTSNYGAISIIHNFI